MSTLPQEVKTCLWSYDTDKIDLFSPDDRFRIVLNILNHGTKQAVLWLWENFTEEEIRAVISKSIATEWNRKSLSFWSKIYNVSPARVGRFIMP